MFTNRRLTEVFQSAEKYHIDKDSKYVFFSDLHRGDDSISDEFSRNQVIMMAAMEYYYDHGYTYVEVGDGDELWENKSFKHIRLAHSDVFDILKKFYDDERYIVIYGNHNNNLKNPKYVEKNMYHYYDVYNEREEKLFDGIKPKEGIVLHYDETDQDILVVHGHQGDLQNDQLSFFTKFSVRFFWRFIHLVGFKNPSSPARNQYKTHKIEKAYSKWIERHETMLICGHTHRLHFPKEGQLPYFNSGCCIHLKGVAGIEICEGAISVIQWRITAGVDGVLSIVRHTIRGPKNLEEFKSVFNQ